MKFKKSAIIAAVGVIVSLIVIVVILSMNVRPYLSVSQAVANPSQYNNQEIQVIGIVQGFSGANFNLTEGENSILVETSSVVIPDDIVNGTQVVITGIFHSSLVLTASLILTQCS
jgi:cytochrome c-type biogenesis protein CcmE